MTIPDEATDASTALSVADERLYAHKEQQPTRRGTAHELLLRTLDERDAALRRHVAGVAALAVAVGQRLGLGGSELDELRLAAELHDVGKLAIPDAVLQKPEPLDDDEWEFIRQHTLIGQRILAGRPVAEGRRPDRPLDPRELGRHAATRTVSPARRSRSRPGSSPPATRTRR